MANPHSLPPRPGLQFTPSPCRGPPAPQAAISSRPFPGFLEVVHSSKISFARCIQRGAFVPLGKFTSFCPLAQAPVWDLSLLGPLAPQAATSSRQFPEILKTIHSSKISLRGALCESLVPLGESAAFCPLAQACSSGPLCGTMQLLRSVFVIEAPHGSGVSTSGTTSRWPSSVGLSA